MDVFQMYRQVERMAQQADIIIYKKNSIGQALKIPVAIYRFCYEKKRIKRILIESERLHGGDLNFQVGRILNSWSIKESWRKCE